MYQLLPRLSFPGVWLPFFVTSLDPGPLDTLPGYLSMSVASCVGVWLCLKRTSVIHGNEQEHSGITPISFTFTLVFKDVFLRQDSFSEILQVFGERSPDIIKHLPYVIKY